MPTEEMNVEATAPKVRDAFKATLERQLSAEREARAGFSDSPNATFSDGPNATFSDGPFATFSDGGAPTVFQDSPPAPIVAFSDSPQAPANHQSA